MTHEVEAHILVVDDDERIRGLLQRFLRRHGFLVSVARDAAHARRLLGGLDFDLIVLDVMMPGEDGLALTAGLRERIATPILLLTARGETGERIAGLEAGADDYLAKPFDPKELLLRINAILRRMPAQVADPGLKVLHLGPVRYDIERGEMWQGDVPIRLTATESQLMRIFAALAGRGGEPHAAGGGSRAAGRAGAGARGGRADHPPAPQDRARSETATLPADGARLGLHAGAGLSHARGAIRGHGNRAGRLGPGAGRAMRRGCRGRRGPRSGSGPPPDAAQERARRWRKPCRRRPAGKVRGRPRRRPCRRSPRADPRSGRGRSRRRRVDAPVNHHLAFLEHGRHQVRDAESVVERLRGVELVGCAEVERAVGRAVGKPLRKPGMDVSCSSRIGP